MNEKVTKILKIIKIVIHQNRYILIPFYFFLDLNQRIEPNATINGDLTPNPTTKNRIVLVIG